MPRLTNRTLPTVIKRIRKKVREYREPAVTQVSWARDPYLVLVSCLISLRTKDEVTSAATERLLKLAESPEEMVQLTPKQIEEAIYPASFFRNKAKTLLRVSKRILEEHDAKVPDTIDELVAMKGIGRKTANLVVSLGYGKLAICVDTHVHRISNRLGYVETKDPHGTEFALRKTLPKKYWIEYNDLLVTYGQNVCTPISPKCDSECVVKKYCAQKGVGKHR